MSLSWILLLPLERKLPLWIVHRGNFFVFVYILDELKGVGGFSGGGAVWVTEL